jgi:carboxypeptidase C (cathepsin A)
VQSGFSYDKLMNGSIDLFNDRISRMTRPNFKKVLKDQTPLKLIGTFPSNNYGSTTNTSMNSAKALWQVMQVFLNDFLEHKTSDKRVSIWTESYGGHYGPAIAGVILRQNEKVSSGSLSKNKKIELDTLGIISGCIDGLVEEISKARFALNNTYEALINQQMYDRMRRQWPQCAAAIRRCRQVSDMLDREQTGGNSQVNSVCFSTFQACSPVMQTGIGDNRSGYDIAAPAKDPSPPPYPIGYLAQKSVQEALGVPLNYTDVIESVNQVFVQTGDMHRGGKIEDMALALDNGIKVALVFGDRDAVSVAISLVTS